MEKIGNMLKEKRIERGMSVEDISEKTRLTTKHIKALEEGDISFFHEDLSYLRFFVKSYCDAVDIDFEDVKDELRNSINDYTMTFAHSEQLSHEEIEHNIAKSEKLSKVQTADVKQTRKRRRRTKPDVSLISLVAIIGVVVLVLMFAFIIFMQTDSGKDKKPVNNMPIAGENDKDAYPSDQEKQKEEQKKEQVKELEIVKNDVTDYTINHVSATEKLKIETKFNGSNSGYSVTVDEKDIRENKIYNVGQTAKSEIEVKKGTKISIYIGCMVQTDIKINGKVVKTDSSINPSTYPGYCPSNTLTFTVGEINESAK